MAIKDNYLTVSEAAERLSVSKQTIYRWVGSEKLIGEKVGGVTLINKKSVTKAQEEQLEDSFFRMLAYSIPTFIRSEYKYSEDDEIEIVRTEDEFLSYKVKRKNGKCDKVKIGGLEVVYSFGRKSNEIKNIKFQESSVSECEDIDISKEEKGKD